MAWRQSSKLTMIILGLSVLSSLSAEASSHPHGPKNSSRHHQERGREIGNAVFYGEAFQGRTMANGKPYDVNAFTAASRILPLGTRARVINRHSGRSAIVTITDRGRLRANHVIVDLTPRAAQAIGLTVKEGVAPVIVQPIR